MFRGSTLRIRVENPNGGEKGVKKLVLNGAPLEGNLVPVLMMKEENEVVVVIG